MRLASFWKHFPLADQQAATLVRETLLFQQKFNCDFVKITPAGTWQAVCMGAKDTPLNDALGRRVVNEPIIKTAGDWLAIPDLAKTQPYLMQEVINTCRTVCDKVTVPVIATVFCPVTQAVQIAGIVTFLEHVKNEPEKVKAGIAKITANTLYVMDEFKKAGTNGIFFVTQHRQTNLMLPDVYKEFGEPADIACLESCADLDFNIFHIHGEDVYIDLTPLPGNCLLHFEYSPANIEQLGNFTGSLKNILTGIPVSEMFKCSTEEDMRACVQKYRDMNPVAVAVSPSCVIPVDFPEALLKKWISVLKSSTT